MNKILNILGIVCVLTFLSCNEDSGDETTPVVEKQLSKIEHYAVYPSGGLFLEGTTTFENDRPVLKQLSNNGQVWMETTYTYSQEGLLTEEKTTMPLSGSVSMHSAVYDAQNRIIEYVYSYSSTTQGSGQSGVTFSYGNNIITTHYNDGDNINHLNSAGKIYKISNNGNTFREFEYDGNNIIKLIESSHQLILTYNNIIPKGNYVKYEDYIFGGKNNRILFNLLNGYPWESDKLLVNQQSTFGYSTTWSYDFDAEGYPIVVYRVEGTGTPILVEKIYYQ